MFIISASSPYIYSILGYIFIYTLHGREISKLQKIRLKLLKNVKKNISPGKKTEVRNKKKVFFSCFKLCFVLVYRF